MTMATGERLLRVSEVLEVLGISQAKLWRLTNAGELHPQRALYDRRIALFPEREVHDLKLRLDQERGSGDLNSGKAEASAA